MKPPRHRFLPRLLLILAASCVVAVVLRVVRFGQDPAGIYDAPRFGYSGYSYWRFAGGRVSVVHPGGMDDFGVYERRGGEWIWTTPGGHEARLEPSLRFLRIVDSNGKNEEGSPFTRLFLTPEWFHRDER